MSLMTAVMGAPVTARIDVIRYFHGDQYHVPVEVWDTPEGIVGRALDNVLSRDADACILLIAVDEDPELDLHEMGIAKNALWAARHYPSAN